MLTYLFRCRQFRKERKTRFSFFSLKLYYSPFSLNQNTYSFVCLFWKLLPTEKQNKKILPSSSYVFSFLCLFLKIWALHSCLLVLNILSSCRTHVLGQFQIHPLIQHAFCSWKCGWSHTQSRLPQLLKTFYYKQHKEVDYFFSCRSYLKVSLFEKVKLIIWKEPRTFRIIIRKTGWLVVQNVCSKPEKPFNRFVVYLKILCVIIEFYL